MYCFIIFACFLSLSTASLDKLINDIENYYDNSTSLRNMRIVWDDHREAIEHSLANAMQETIGKKGLNGFKTKNTVLRLTLSYYQQQGPVGIVFSKLNLTALPQCWLPDAVLSLSSNVLKIETILTKMIINANFRKHNTDDVIEKVALQDPLQTSPFLFLQGPEGTGSVTFLVEGCVLSGYIIARLKGGKIILGHDNLKVTKCEYSVEIYQKGRGDPPIIAPFADQNAGNTLDLNHYIMMTLREEFVTKIQAALFSIVNTSAIFQENLSTYEKEQEDIFLRTSSKLTKMIRNLNKRLLSMNGATVEIPNYYPVNEVDLVEMNLTGLDTAYISFTGGPFKLNNPMVGEQIRFSKLLVRGKTYDESGDLAFAAEINDFAINIEIDINDGTFNNVKAEVAGYRNIEMQLYNYWQAQFISHVKLEVSRIIIGIIMDYFNQRENLKLLSQKDGVAGSLAMTETGSETDEASFVRLNEYIDDPKK